MKIDIIDNIKINIDKVGYMRYIYVSQIERRIIIMAIEQSKNYFANLLKNSKASKKQIAVYLDDITVERIDMIIKIFSSISDTKSFSRNTLIEEAVNKFLKESEEFLSNEMGINVDDEIEESKSQKYDTVIFSSKGRGFEETFMGEKDEQQCWYPCKVSDNREQNLKYIAIYRGAPVSAITHYAKIKKFEIDPIKGYKVCYFEGSPIELPNKIELGNKDGCFFVGTKYTSLDSLLNAKKADDIIFG